MTITDPRSVAVLGARGRTGSRVVDALRVRGAPVRILSRGPYADRAVDLHDRDSLRRELRGARAVFVASHPHSICRRPT